MSEILLVNPRRRRRVSKKRPVRRRKAVARKRNPVRRRRRAVASRVVRRRRRRNPIVTRRGVQGQVMNALTGATGALGLDVALGYIPIPANLKGGLVGTGVKAALAIALGIVATKSKLVKSATAAKMADGALTVVLHDALKSQLANFAPGVKLGEYMEWNPGAGLGYVGSGYNPHGMYLPDISTDDLSIQDYGMGEYMDADGSGMDFYNTM